MNMMKNRYHRRKKPLKRVSAYKCKRVPLKTRNRNADRWLTKAFRESCERLYLPVIFSHLKIKSRLLAISERVFLSFTEDRPLSELHLFQPLTPIASWSSFSLFHGFPVLVGSNKLCSNMEFSFWAVI